MIPSSNFCFVLILLGPAMINVQAQDVNKTRYYEEIGPFHGGYAKVIQNGKIGFINTKGELVIPCMYDEEETDDFSDYFRHGVVPVKKKDKWGAIDSLGNVIVPFEYDKIYSFRNNGMSVVIKGDKEGYLNYNGEIILPVIYDDVWLMQNGFAKIILNGKTGYMDSTGKKIIECKYDDGYSFSDGLLAVKKGETWGFIDQNEKEIIPCKYHQVNIFSEGLASVTLTGKTGFIDKKGELIIPFIYDTGYYSFYNGFAGILINKKWGYINNSGKTIIPAQYEEYGSGQYEYSCFVIKNDKNKFALFDSTGKQLTNFDYDAIYRYGNNKIEVKRNGKAGVINNKGEIIIPLEFDDYIEISETGIYNTIKNGKMGYIDSVGKTIIPFIYDDYEQFISMFNDSLTSVTYHNIWRLINLKGECITGCGDVKNIESKFENSVIGTKGEIKDGYRSGKWIYRYESGKIKKIENYQRGMKDGVFKEWSENGRLYISAYYKNDTLDGRYREFRKDNGRKSYDFVYREGKIIKRKKIRLDDIGDEGVLMGVYNR